eukprot:CAMPEP_0170399496 /NCGR_PEP_ID=MMETSP0117_2-20130122/23989_1 /TAXON_ID=400756 /ORGANISM="Durinskia baltica, Strain CSIRO CS-38" /LENGTH=57 /DNA_ID=CAMNT_0010656169 /DNA_START=78 /DNA_END=248 /DNA_ORIENTATION=-
MDVRRRLDPGRCSSLGRGLEKTRPACAGAARCPGAQAGGLRTTAGLILRLTAAQIGE